MINVIRRSILIIPAGIFTGIIIDGVFLHPSPWEAVILASIFSPLLFPFSLTGIHTYSIPYQIVMLAGVLLWVYSYFPLKKHRLKFRYVAVILTSIKMMPLLEIYLSV